MRTVKGTNERGVRLKLKRRTDSSGGLILFIFKRVINYLHILYHSESTIYKNITHELSKSQYDRYLKEFTLMTFVPLSIVLEVKFFIYSFCR